jgi:integrase
MTKSRLYFSAYRETPGGRIKKKYFGRGPEEKGKALIWEGECLKQGYYVKSQSKGLYFFDITQQYINLKAISKHEKYNILTSLNKNIFKTQKWDDIPVEKLNLSHLIDIEKDMISKGLTLSTRNRIKAMCRAICQWATDNNIIANNPFSKLKLDKIHEGKAPDLITDDELVNIYNNSSEHMKLAIKVMINTGVRPGISELFSIKMSDIDYKNRGIWITRQKTHGKKSLLPVKDQFLNEIYELHQNDMNRVYLIEYKNKQVKCIKKAWQNALTKAGISRRIRIYDLRHYYASKLFQGGTDMKVASQLMGHSSPNMTLNTYYHLLEYQGHTAVNKMVTPDFSSYGNSTDKNSSI